jgi:hypothetical protein
MSRSNKKRKKGRENSFIYLFMAAVLVVYFLHNSRQTYPDPRLGICPAVLVVHCHLDFRSLLSSLEGQRRLLNFAGIIANASATAIAASAVNVILFVLLPVIISPIMKIKKVVGGFMELSKLYG